MDGTIRMLGDLLVTDHLKEQFQREISTRRLAHTTSLLDLCKVLHAQCQLNQEHLDTIKAYLPATSGHLLDEVYAHWQMSEPGNGTTNVYARLRQSPNSQFLSSRSEEPRIPARSVIPVNPGAQQHHFEDHRRRDVYRLIADEIGKKWRELGRELNVAEGHLDAIDTRHRESLTDKVYAMLAKFEERVRQRDQKSSLLVALDKVRRKDLVREVQEMLMDE